METSVQCVLIGRCRGSWEVEIPYILPLSPSTVYHCAQTVSKCFSPSSHGHRESPLPQHGLSINTPVLWQRVRANSHRMQMFWLVTHFVFCFYLFIFFSDKVIRHRACSLKDTAHAIFAAELDPEFDRMCEEIKEARKKRGKK